MKLTDSRHIERESDAIYENWMVDGEGKGVLIVDSENKKESVVVKGSGSEMDLDWR